MLHQVPFSVLVSIASFMSRSRAAHCSSTDSVKVLLPGFQNGRDIKASLSKRAGSSFGKKRKNLKNRQNFTTFRVNKMFSHEF
jgi:hypothetical protein